MHYYYFSLEAVLLSRLNSGDIEALGQRENSQKSVKFIVTKMQTYI